MMKEKETHPDVVTLMKSDGAMVVVHPAGLVMVGSRGLTVTVVGAPVAVTVTVVVV
jgi:hypothetical protein